MNNPIFTVVDLETTGMGPSARIIEIACVRVENGAITERKNTLINPGIHIPSFITELTGISDRMVWDAPGFSEVAKEYLDYMKGTIVVAHNAHFDVSILNQELQRTGFSEMTGQALCTVRLSRRLHRTLKSHSLGNLVKSLGIRLVNAHRAAGDAEATALLLIRMLAKLEEEENRTSAEEILAYQYLPVKLPKMNLEKIKKLRESVASSFPERPGIYQFIGKDEQVLYVGKSANLKERILTYFSGFHAKSKKWPKMLQQTSEIRFLETGDELHALVIESRLIKRFKPKFNTVQLKLRQYPFIRLNRIHPYPTLSVLKEIREDGADYFGPFNGKAVTSLLMDVAEHSGLIRPCDDVTFSRGKLCSFYGMKKCSGPCAGEVSKEDYQKGIELIRRLLSGRGKELLLFMEGKMSDFAEAEQFEQAAKLRDKLREIEKLTFKHVTSGGSLNENTFLMVRVKEGEIDYYLVRFGMLVTHGVLVQDGDQSGFWDEISFFYEMGKTVKEMPWIRTDAVDEIRIVLNWTYKNRKSLKFLFPSEFASKEMWIQAIRNNYFNAESAPNDVISVKQV